MTIGQFQKFVEVTKYLTEAEKLGFGDSSETVWTDQIPESHKQRYWRTPGLAVTDDSPVSDLRLRLTYSDTNGFQVRPPSGLSRRGHD